MTFFAAERAARLMGKERENTGGLPEWALTYHAVLAVNRGATGFRGINGALPARTRVPSIYSTIPLPPN